MANSFGKKDLEIMQQYFLSKLSAWTRTFDNDTEKILCNGEGRFCDLVKMLLLIDLNLKFCDSELGEISKYASLHYSWSQKLFHDSDDKSSDSDSQGK